MRPQHTGAGRLPQRTQPTTEDVDPMARPGNRSLAWTALDGRVRGSAADAVANVFGSAFAPAPSALGVPRHLTGSTGRVRATVLAMDDGAQPAPFQALHPHTRLVSVLLRIDALSGHVTESTANLVHLIDTSGRWHEPSHPSAAGPPLEAFSVVAGDLRLGWVTFVLDRDAQVDEVRVALDAGMAADSARWSPLLANTATPPDRVVSPGAPLGTTATIALVPGCERGMT